jgi:putative nucleotidyltransferase with HDIG domain
MLSILGTLMAFYLYHNEPQIFGSVPRLFVYLTIVVSTIVLGRILSMDPWRAEVVPVTVTTMVLAIVYGHELAILTAVSVALILAPSTSGSLAQFVMLIAVAVTAVVPLGRIASRSRLVKVGFQAAAACFLISWGFEFLQGEAVTGDWLADSLFIRSARSAGWCLVAGYLVAGSLPFIEQAFGVVTNISLLEMSDISHPLLRDLVRLAPGTYNHSIAVATIGETAAERIGANGLLVRVGAYYHDIGKMLKPHYFVENMTDGSQSRHQHLAPAMSTLIIIGHVKDGVDLAMQYNLPRALIDFIEQHHGTTLVEYFYREATRQADKQPDQKTTVEESSFRYPGPKPQTREAGVLMLADAVESASRTLSDPTPKRIENLVHDLTMKRLLDGQFDECSLMLSEIHVIEESLSKSLIGIYHSRIKYPEQRTA